MNIQGGMDYLLLGKISSNQKMAYIGSFKLIRNDDLMSRMSDKISLKNKLNNHKGMGYKMR
jgi:hypothetical protein